MPEVWQPTAEEELRRIVRERDAEIRELKAKVRKLQTELKEKREANVVALKRGAR